MGGPSKFATAEVARVANRVKAKRFREALAAAAERDLVAIRGEQARLREECRVRRAERARNDCAGA